MATIASMIYSFRTGILAAATAVALAVGLAPGAPAIGGSALPLGDGGLAETRTTETLARGVTLTRITRGTEPAPTDQINTTTRGPWVVNVLT